MPNTLVSVSSGAAAAATAKTILERGGSAADAVAAASMMQIVNAAGTYVTFAGMLVGLYYEASTGTIYSVDGDYGIPEAKQGANLSALYGEGRLGAGVLVPGYWAAIREMLARFGRLPFDAIVDPAIERCAAGFEPHDRLLKRLRYRARTSPGIVETFTLERGKVVQPELLRTLERVRAHGIDTMYTGVWGQRFVETVQSAGGVITEADMAGYRANIGATISTRYRDFTLFAPPPPNVGGLITLFILRMLERLDLAALGHYTESPDAFVALISGLRAYMPFLNRLLGNSDEAAFAAALGGQTVRLEDCLADETVDRIWDAIRAGRLQTVPLDKPNNTDSVAAIDREGNIAIIIHSACATTGRDGLVVDGISLPRMAAEAPGTVAQSDKRVAGIFSPVMALGRDRLLAVAAIHASLYEKQSAVLINALEYGQPLDEANAFPTPLFPDYDRTGAFSEVLLTERFTPAFLEGLRSRGLRFKDAREGGLGQFVTEENLDLLESPLVGLEVDIMSERAAGVTSPRYDGTVL